MYFTDKKSFSCLEDVFLKLRARASPREYILYRWRGISDCSALPSGVRVQALRARDQLRASRAVSAHEQQFLLE